MSGNSNRRSDRVIYFDDQDKWIKSLDNTKIFPHNEADQTKKASGYEFAWISQLPAANCKQLEWNLMIPWYYTLLPDETLGFESWVGQCLCTASQIWWQRNSSLAIPKCKADRLGFVFVKSILKSRLVRKINMDSISAPLHTIVIVWTILFSL